MNGKKELKTRFCKIYEGCVLYAIHLDGFSHAVFYKDGSGIRHIDGFSVYSYEQHSEPEMVGNTFRAFNDDKAKALFMGYGNVFYQNNAKEYVYKDVKQW